MTEQEKIESGRSRSLAWYYKNKDKARERNRALYETSPAVWRLSNFRNKAKKLGLPFDLTVEDMEVPSHCPVLGIPLVRYAGKATGPTPDSPSLDRIIPEKGYVKSNVIMVSMLANAIKQNATPDQIRKVADFYERLQRSRESAPIIEASKL